MLNFCRELPTLSRVKSGVKTRSEVFTERNGPHVTL
jgi:hypothetical protein